MTGKKHAACYKTPRDGGLCFTVVHYAGSVQYDVTGMLEKNRDTLPNSILYTMKSKCGLMSLRHSMASGSELSIISCSEGPPFTA